MDICNQGTLLISATGRLFCILFLSQSVLFSLPLRQYETSHIRVFLVSFSSHSQKRIVDKYPIPVLLSSLNKESHVSLAYLMLIIGISFGQRKIRKRYALKKIPSSQCFMQQGHCFCAYGTFPYVLCWVINHSILQQALMSVLQRYNANIEAINSFMICIVMGMRRSTTTSRALQPSSPQMMTHDDTSVTILFEPDAW